jgi:hypothetical protein
VDRAAGAAAGEPDRPDVLERDVLQEVVDAERSRLEFCWVNTQVHLRDPFWMVK